MNKNWWKISLVAVIPAASMTPIIASCAESAVTHISTKDPIIDPATSSAAFEITLMEQPLDNSALVSVIQTSGDHLVSLFPDGALPYSSETSLVLPVKERKINVNACFSDFVGDDTNSTFNLEINYRNSNNRVVRSIIQDMTLSTQFHHPQGDEHVHIVDINDFHGAAPGYGDTNFPSTSPKNPGVIRLMDKVSDILIKNPGSVFLSAGDNNSGEAFSSATHAETMFPLLKAMGVQYSAVGNHAFEWGYDDLTTNKYDSLGRTDKTLGHYLVTSNILEHPYYQDHEWLYDVTQPGYDSIRGERDYSIWKNQIVDWADPYKLISLNGHLVCLVGLTTQKAMSDGNQAIVQNTSIIDYAPAIYYATRYCCDSIGVDWYNSIDTFVMLTHVESEQKKTDSDAFKIGQQALIYDPEFKDDPQYERHDPTTNKLSLVISAHSHKSVNDSIQNRRTNKTVCIGQASTAGREFLDSDFVFDNTKPIGKRWKSVSLQNIAVKPFWNHVEEEQPDPSLWTDDQKARALDGAKQELQDFINKPKNQMVKDTIEAYNNQSDIALKTLQTVIGHSETGHKFDPIRFGSLGHEYCMPKNVIEPAGSWSNAASIIGFDYLFSDEITSPTSSITTPAISIIAIDSINGEIRPNSDVTLEDMYNLQSHDNATHFGFISVWQLAAIIDYFLAGGVIGADGHTYFNYEDPKQYMYYPNDNKYERNVIENYKAYDQDMHHGEFIKLTDNIGFEPKCCYPAGPAQWYGFKFGVKRLTEKKDQANTGRTFQLRYVPKKLGNKYDELDPDFFPDIQIYDPTAGDPFETIYDTDKWVDVQDWLVDKEDKWHGLIPCIVNDFIYTGGNKQYGMFAAYFEYNKNQYGKSFDTALFSTLIRDLMIEYCNKTRLDPELVKMDGSYEATNDLITFYD